MYEYDAVSAAAARHAFLLSYVSVPYLALIPSLPYYVASTRGPRAAVPPPYDNDFEWLWAQAAAAPS